MVGQAHRLREVRLEHEAEAAATADLGGGLGEVGAKRWVSDSRKQIVDLRHRRRFSVKSRTVAPASLEDDACQVQATTRLVPAVRRIARPS